MATLYERLRNVFTDEIDRSVEQNQERLIDAYRELDKSEGIADINASSANHGRTQVATAIIEKLAVMESEIRADWQHYMTVEPGNERGLSAYFEGRIVAYNTLAAHVHDLDNDGVINVQNLPQILDFASVERGVLAEVRQEQELQNHLSVAPRAGLEMSL